MASDKLRAFVAAKKGTMSDGDLIDTLLEMGVDEDEAERLVSAVSAALPPPPANPGRAVNAPALDERDLTAPYRFVALNDRVTPPEDEVLAAWKDRHLHDAPLAGGLSGTIELEIAFDGPMLIGEEKGNEVHPLRLGDIPVIPGATLRGLTRSTLEIAAFARLSQTNLHRRFGIRDFSHHLFRDEARRDVKAGWLEPVKEDGKVTRYVIHPCEWRRVKIRDLTPASDSGAWHLDWLKKPMADRYGAMGMKTGKTFDFTKAQHFRLLPRQPGEHELAPGRLAPDAAGGFEGVYVFSNTSPTLQDVTTTLLDQQEAPRQEEQDRKPHAKKTEAVFAARANGPPIPVPPDVWTAFELNNSTPSRHAPKPAGNWATLKPTLEDGHRIPVFWVQDGSGGVADFGLVRVFKRSFDASIGDVLLRTGGGAHRLETDPEAFAPDFVEALFGFVHEPESGPGDDPAEPVSHALAHRARHLKGRVGFSFARLSPDTPGAADKPVATVMSAPRPSFAPFYLESTQKKDWSDPSARLAGRKRYPARGWDKGAIQNWLSRHKGNGKDETLSRLRFLVPARDGTRLTFTATMRVHNVSLAELGGLLYALTFGGDQGKRHMIGRAKTAGAGEAAIRIGRLRLEANDAGATVPDATSAIKAFTDYMGGRVPGWDRSAPVRELLATADPQKGRTLRLDYLELKRHRAVREAVYHKDGDPLDNRQRPRLLPG